MTTTEPDLAELMLGEVEVDQSDLIPGAGDSAAVVSARNLPPSFWEADPTLGKVRAMAWARMVSPDAVLGALLAILAANWPPAVQIPPIVGTRSSLATYALIVAPSGGGKSTAIGVANDLLAIEHPARKVGIGSGEGLIEAYLELDPEDKTKKRQATPGLLVEIDEGQVLAQLTARKGATLPQTLRSMWTGADVGQANASQETKRYLKDGEYSLGLVMAIQPVKAGPLFSDEGGGTPQRFVMLSAEDPNIPLDVDLPDPAPIRWRPPSLGARQQALVIPDPVRSEIRDARHAVVTGEIQGDPMESHANLCRLKVAVLLGSLRGHGLEPTEQDWELAGVVMATSRAVRMDIEAHLDREQSKQSKAAAQRAGDRRRAEMDAEDQKVAEAVERYTKSIAAKVAEAGPNGLTISQAKQGIRGPWRKEIGDEVIENMIISGLVVERDGRLSHRRNKG